MIKGFIIIWFSFLAWLLIGSIVLLTDDVTIEWLPYKHWPDYQAVTMAETNYEILVWPKTLCDARKIKEKFEGG